MPKNILSWKILQVRKPFYITLQFDVFENRNVDDKQNFTGKQVHCTYLLMHSDRNCLNLFQISIIPNTTDVDPDFERFTLPGDYPPKNEKHKKH